MGTEELILQEMQNLRSEMNKGFRECRNDIKFVHTKIDSTKDAINGRINATQKSINDVDKKFINKNWKMVLVMVMLGVGSGGVGSVSADMIKKYLNIFM